MLEPHNADDKLLALIMPVYNEGDAVIPVISTLFLTVRYPFNLIVVYDSHDDPTISSVKKLQTIFKDIYLIKNEFGMGVLNAIKTGLRHADTQYVGIWVSYHVDPFGILNKMVERLEEGFDLVSASRFSYETIKARGGVFKRLLSYTGNSILNKMVGMPITDITTSLKVYRRRLFNDIEIETVVNGGWALSTELAVKSAIKGYRLCEVPLEKRNVNLIHGVTNFRVFRQLSEYFRWLYLGWKNRKVIRLNSQNISNRS
ncbi:MAG: glycosyltransferase family 2 protein [Candidatus Nitrosocaldus sp.]